jgi:hypothetical protein
VIISKVADFLAGRISRWTMLRAIIPVLGLVYFGTLALAVILFPQSYDWRVSTISQLLYPRRNPAFYPIAATGVALSGMLILPVAGYLGRRLRMAAPVAANVGVAGMSVGALALILTGLISSHPAVGGSSFPRLHEILARAAATGLGIGLVMFVAAGVKGRRELAKRADKSLIPLQAIWTLMLFPLILAGVVQLGVATNLGWAQSIRQVLHGTFVSHLGFWEWVGSVFTFVFLGSAVWLLPE